MIALRAFCIAFFIFLAVYTVFVVAEHGVNFLPTFFGSIVALNWSGQFNLDFAGYLAISALWIVWRHEFSGLGIALALLALFGGQLFFALYLIFALTNAKDVRSLLLGTSRV